MKTARKITEKDPIIMRLLEDPRYKVRADGAILTRARKRGPGLGPWRRAGWISPSRGGQKLYRRLTYLGHELYEQRIVFAARNGHLCPYSTVNHDDLNGLNNHPVNLGRKQLSHGENIRHARRLYKRMGMSAAEAKQQWIKGLAGAGKQLGAAT